MRDFFEAALGGSIFCAEYQKTGSVKKDTYTNNIETKTTALYCLIGKRAAQPALWRLAAVFSREENLRKKIKQQC